MGNNASYLHSPIPQRTFPAPEFKEPSHSGSTTSISQGHRSGHGQAQTQEHGNETGRESGRVCQMIGEILNRHSVPVNSSEFRTFDLFAAYTGAGRLSSRCFPSSFFRAEFFFAFWERRFSTSSAIIFFGRIGSLLKVKY